MEDVIYAGIDLHSTTTTIAFAGPEGPILETIRRPTEADALQQAMQRWAAETRWAVLEAGSQSYWAAEQLSQVVDEVRICDPRANQTISRRSGPKNDCRDAEQLARLLRLGETKNLYRPPMGQRMRLRRRFGYYKKATDQLRRHIQYIKSQMRFWGVQVPKRAGYPRNRADCWLEQVPAAVRTDMEAIDAQIRQMQQWKRQAWQRVRQAGEDYWEIPQFRRIPGMGPVRAHGLSAYVMDPHRFRSASALYKYCRLGVRRRSSGGQTVAPEQLEKAGHGRLKAISSGAVRTAVFGRSEDNEVARFYRASLARTGGNADHAMLNTQRKLVKTCWGLWKTETEYDPELFCSGTG